MPPLDLNQMSLEEKLETMEALWDDLCRQEEQLASPGWHGDILEKRAASLDRGEEMPEDWETAKEAIKKDLR
jgi:hypothetical protein